MIPTDEEPKMRIPILLKFASGLETESRSKLLYEVTTETANRLEQSLDDGSYALSDRAKVEIFGDGVYALFAGVYDQTWENTGELAFRKPFFLLQQQEGCFQGYIEDMYVPLEAVFEGRLESGVQVEFQKKYENTPDIVNYRGEFSTERGLYLGKWEIVTSGERNDFELTGKFLMKEI